VGHALYEARRELCRRFNLRRILAGGRLWNYSEHAEKMSPQEYAQRVAAGEFRDLVLSFQLREGFHLRGVMPNYLRDPRSHNHASLIEWLNPDYKPHPTGARKVRVACVQYQMRKVTSFAEFARQVSYFVDVAADYRSDFVLLPELFSVQLLSRLDALSPQEGMKKLADYTPRFKKLMSDLARQYGLTIIAGSHPVQEGKKLLNIAHVCLPDGSIVAQPKLHITPNERKWWGISGGQTLGVVDTPKAKIGVLICYDVEFPEAVRHLADEGAEILFVPFCTDNRQGYLRVRYCAQARAIENQIYVALAGNVGNLAGCHQHGRAIRSGRRVHAVGLCLRARWHRRRGRFQRGNCFGVRSGPRQSARFPEQRHRDATPGSSPRSVSICRRLPRACRRGTCKRKGGPARRSN
jgi:predicted amidohydrolase